MGTIQPLYVNLLLATLILSIAIPVVLCIICKKKFGGSIKYLVIGILVAFLTRSVIGNLITKGVNDGLTGDNSVGEIIAISVVVNAIILLIAFFVKRFIFVRSKRRRDNDPDRYTFDGATSIGDKGSTLQFAIGFAAIVGIVYCGMTAFDNYSLSLLINQGLVEDFIKNYQSVADQEAARLLIKQFAEGGITTFILPFISLLSVLTFEIGNTLKAYCTGYKRDNGFMAILSAIVFSIIFVIPPALASSEVITNPIIPTVIQLVIGIVTLLVGIVLYKKSKPIEEDIYGGY